MNWYLKNLHKSLKDKTISGLTDSGDFVKGSFVSVKPDIRRNYQVSIDVGKNKIAQIFATNIRKIELEKKPETKRDTSAQANFCGYLYDVEKETNKKDNSIKTVVLTKKEPHTGKKITIVVPSTHIFNEDK